MSWLSNLRIGAKLTACFILVALVAGVIGLVGIKCIKDITRMDIQLYEGNTVPLGQIGRVAENFERVRVNLREVILDKNYSSKANCASTIRDLSRQIDDELAAFEKTLTTDEGRREFSRLKSALGRFAPIREQIVSLAMAGREDEAYALAKSAGPAEVVKEIEDSINALVDLEVAQAKERSSQNASAGQRTTWLVIVVLLAGMALAVGLGLFLSRAISRPLGSLAEAAAKMSRGELDIEVGDGTKDEIGQLAGSFKEVAEKISALVSDAGVLARAAAEGKLDVRADAGRHQGEYRKVIEGMNGLMVAVAEPVEEMRAVLNRMAVNDYKASIEKEYAGIWNELKGAINNTKSAFLRIQRVVDHISNGDLSDLPELKQIGRRCENDEIMPAFVKMMEAIEALVKDVNSLARAAAEGKLDVRADAGRHQGEYRKVIEGMNGLMVAVAEPVEELISVLRLYAVNDLTKEMVRDYAGIWGELKHATNEVHNRLTNIHRTIYKISNGDLSDLEFYRKVGRRSQNDELVPGFIRMIEAIGALVNDADMLAQAASEGRLDVRADAGRHQGEYRKVIEGINRTLEAVIGPINEAAACLKEMAEGNLNVRVKGDYRGDHAIIKNALNTTLDVLNKVIKEEALYCLKEMAAGNLDVAVSGDYRGDYAIIKDALNKTVEDLNEILAQVAVAIEQVNNGAQQVSDSSQALSQGAAESASSMDQVTSSMQQINVQVKQNAENAVQANQLAAQARTNAEKGSEQMAQMVKAMEDINESAANISKIIKAIDEIAFQTNLLALNAAVEAARAGKHGKGFTVVAEEVRNLAQRSAAAAKETAELIESSIKKTEVGTRIAEETSKALEEIVLGVAKVTDLVSEIASASKEQALGVGQVNQGLSQVDQVIQQNSASAEELAAASEEMSGQAQMVREMLSRFKLKKAYKGDSHHAANLSGHAAKVPGGVKSFRATGLDQVKGALAAIRAKSEAAAAPAGEGGSKNVRPEEIIALDDVDYGGF